MSGRIGRYLIILGIAALLMSLMGMLGVFEIGAASLFLIIGWPLVIMGAISISLRALRVTAWAFFLMGICLYFYYFYFEKSWEGVNIHIQGPIVSSLLIAGAYLFLGLILVVISFVKHRKSTKK